MLKVFQIQLTDDEIALLNREGWGCTDPRIQAYGRRSLGEVGPIELYDHVANVDTDDLEAAFILMNLWNDESKITRIGESISSMSVGDIIENEQGERFVCASFGFNKI